MIATTEETNTASSNNQTEGCSNCSSCDRGCKKAASPGTNAHQAQVEVSGTMATTLCAMGFEDKWVPY